MSTAMEIAPPVPEDASTPPSLADLKEPEDTLAMEHLEDGHPAGIPPATGDRHACYTVLVAIDESAHARHALEYVVRERIANPARGDCVVLVHVRHVTAFALAADPTGASLTALQQLESSARLASHTLLQRLGGWLVTACGYTHVRAFAIRGDPRTEIVRKAHELHADLVVMGSRGLGVIKRAVLGSVSAYVVAHAPCAVLVVRPGPVADKIAAEVEQRDSAGAIAMAQAEE